MEMEVGTNAAVGEAEPSTVRVEEFQAIHCTQRRNYEQPCGGLRTRGALEHRVALER